MAEEYVRSGGLSCCAWKEWEIEALKAIYPERGAKGVQSLMPHRTIGTIRRRASSLGLASGLNRMNGSCERRETYHTPENDKANRLMRAWRGPVNKGDLRWAA
jgi:hypothetical protein